MNFGLTGGILFAAYLCSSVAQASFAAEHDLANVFGRLPDFGAASVSPGGKAIAFETPVDGSRNIVMLPLEQGVAPWRFTIAGRNAHHLVWRDDTELFATLRRSVRFSFGQNFGQPYGASYYPYYYNVLLAGRHESPVKILTVQFTPPDGPPNGLGEPNSSNPDEAFVEGLFYWPNRFSVTSSLQRMNLQSQRLVSINRGYAGTARWFLNSDGKIVARLDITRAGEYVIFVPEGLSFKKIATLGATEGQVVGLTEDATGLAVLSRRNGGRLELYRLDLADGKSSNPLFSHESSDIRRVLFDEHNSRVIGVTYDDGGLRFAYFSPERRRLQREIEDVLPGRTVNIVSASKDGNKVAVVSSSPKDPPLLQLVNRKTSRIDVYAEAYPDLTATQLGEVRRHIYAGRDGKTLTGLLTLPPERDAEKLPLVVLPAGGFGHSIDAFDWFGHFLAKRGYAVLQAGARTLRSFGDITEPGGLSSWMTETQEDIAAGVDDLIAKGIADPERICIAGADNGGYIALSATIFMPEKYACAINLSGASDLKLLFLRAATSALIPHNVYGSNLLRNRRNYSSEDVVRFSPAYRAKDVTGATLIVFGDRDLGWRQGQIMHEALQSASKRVAYVRLKDEDGSLLRAESRIALLNTVDKFLAEHIGIGSPVPLAAN
jgi:Prolyl oligopeptidase family